MGRRDDVFDVTFVCDSLGSGGIQRVVATLSQEWARRGLKVCVITRSDKTFFELSPTICRVSSIGVWMLRLDETLHRVARYFIRSSKNLVEEFGVQQFWFVKFLGAVLYYIFLYLPYRLYFNIRLNFETWGLRRALKRYGSPIIIAMGTFSNVTAIKATKRMNKRVIISERGDMSRLRLMRPWYKLAKKYYCRADIVTANTHSALRDLREFVSIDKLAFIPNPIAPISSGNARTENKLDLGNLELKKNTPNILIVARLWPEKAHDILLDAFSLIGQEFRNWKLIIAGEGPLKDELHIRAERLNIADRIDWLGAVADLYPIYEAAEIFVLPSRSEGMPNALLEAMSCSRAVIISDASPGPLELVEHDVTGLVVPVDDPAALATAIRRLANDDTLRYRLGEAARKRVSEHHLPRALDSWAAVIGLSK